MEMLEAVNIVLNAVGFAHAAGLDPGGVSGTSVMADAQRYIEQESKHIQNEARWVFNEVTTTVQPDINGRIPAPPHAFYVRVLEQNDVAVAIRGGFVFNLMENTNVWNKPLKLKLKQYVPFDCIPEPVAQYIAASAAARFNENRGERARQPHLFRRMNEAMVSANRYNMQASDARIGNDDISAAITGRYGRWPGVAL